MRKGTQGISALIISDGALFFVKSIYPPNLGHLFRVLLKTRMYFLSHRLSVSGLAPLGLFQLLLPPPLLLLDELCWSHCFCSPPFQKESPFVAAFSGFTAQICVQEHQRIKLFRLSGNAWQLLSYYRADRK